MFQSRRCYRGRRLYSGRWSPETSNILHDSSTMTITGVIDFDSAGVGDPAVDFAAASCFGLQRSSKVYPEIQTALDRVRFYVGTFPLQEALFGWDSGDAEAFRRGIAPYV